MTMVIVLSGPVAGYDLDIVPRPESTELRKLAPGHALAWRRRASAPSTAEHAELQALSVASAALFALRGLTTDHSPCSPCSGPPIGPLLGIQRCATRSLCALPPSTADGSVLPARLLAGSAGGLLRLLAASAGGLLRLHGGVLPTSGLLLRALCLGGSVGLQLSLLLGRPFGSRCLRLLPFRCSSFLSVALPTV